MKDLKSSYIDPTIGNIGDEQSQSMHGGGKTHPGACYPFGMVQLSADTVTGGDNGTGYNYCNNTIEGFSFNHLSGIGWYGDLGNIQIMPVVGETPLRSGTNEFFPLKNGGDGWCSEFSHETEEAKAGYYGVFLDKYNIKAQATVTEHTGFLKVTYPKSENARLLFNLPRRIGGRADFQSLSLIDSARFEGVIKCSPKGGGFGHGGGNISYTLYFYGEVSKPFSDYFFFTDEKKIKENLTFLKGEDVGFCGEFKTEENEQITVKIGISYTDIDGARNNFLQEAKNKNFDDARKEAVNAWENALSCVEVEGNDETDLCLFYTCLYHALSDPRTSVDTDGRYRGADGKIYFAEDYKYRTCFSGWDVYRSEFPLLTIIRPDVVNDEVNTLLNIAELKNTCLPRWELMGTDSLCMVGDPGVIVVSDAVVKGIKKFNVQKAYEIARASCLGVNELGNEEYKTNRNEIEFFNKNGYHPKKLSDTLEENLAEFTLSKFACAIGKEADEKLFYNRSMRSLENYNKRKGFMCPRYKCGFFKYIKNEYDDPGCVESNIYQQSWFFPQDVKKLSSIFGEDRFVNLLERFFERADFGSLWNDDYNHSNEPCHNITHYFNYLGLPQRTQYWTRRVQKEAYKKGPYGFCGNEDVGQLSAWYVLSAMGFAQVCPAVPEYQMNTPLFKKITVKLSEEYHSRKIADTFTIKCCEDPLTNPYIKEIYLNGKKIQRTYLTYEEITQGGEAVIINN